ncbi:MAG TPA: J domain-containing protein, partial [Aquabacterium sp.]|nr:J domain-containing protein [Aquabacterium sp.]
AVDSGTRQASVAGRVATPAEDQALNMSHYARLKVTQDAPVEVIRAAYRVLAAKYHPDRHPEGDPGRAEAHAEMVALNTAYRVLVNPQTRRDYDALLAEKHALRKSKAAAASASVAEPQAESVTNTKVDMEWLPPQHHPDTPSWPMNRRMALLMGSLLSALLMGSAYWISQLVVQHQMEKALSDQYAASPVRVPPIEAVETRAQAVNAVLPVRQALVAPVEPAESAAASAPAEPARQPIIMDLTRRRVPSP